MSGSRIIKSLCQEDQCKTKEGLYCKTIQYLEGMICILPNLEKKSWKMFPLGTEGKTKSLHFVLVFV